MAIRLPDDPKDHYYEDQVAAMLLASGYYLEARLILKSGTEEVLEFDAIATPVNDYGNRKVVEVKSGGWGVGDLFKLYGQSMFTGHRAAWLIHKQPILPTKKDAISEVCQKIPIQTLYFDYCDQHTRDASDKIPTALDFDKEIRSLVFVTAWWARCADRVAQARFKQWVKSDTSGAEIIQKARTYCAELEVSLFKDTPIRRADSMYDAYKAAPQLTSSLVSHVVASSGESLKSVRLTVTDNGERPYLQYMMALEQKARIAIIKNAYDALLLEKSSSNESQPWNGASWDVHYKAFLPDAFHAGMKTLDSSAYANHAAYFLQVFIDVLGGFYFPHDASDLALVASVTGLPVETIPDMVNLLDAFFPIPNGWIFEGSSGIHFIKGVPAYVRGVGCFARGAINGKDWAKSNPSSYWTTKWHNALYALLEPTFKSS